MLNIKLAWDRNFPNQPMEFFHGRKVKVYSSIELVITQGVDGYICKVFY